MRLDVAHLAVANPLDHLLAGGRMAAHQAGGHLEILLFGLFPRCENSLDAAWIDRETSSP